MKCTPSRSLVSLLLCSVLAAGCGPSGSGGESADSGSPALPVRYAVLELSQVAGAEGLAARCEAEEARAREHLTVLENHEAAPTIDGYYRSLDSLQASLDSVSSTVRSLAGVHPDPELRSAAEQCAQLLAKVDTDISLSRALYEAVAALDTSDADATTRHSVDRLLLAFRLSGVDQDAATRKRIRQLRETLLELGQQFDRNIREDVRHLELTSVDDLAGLPDDYVAAHAPDEHGIIRISTRYPDLFPFMEYARRDDLRRELSRISGQRGFPANEPVLRQLLEARHELAGLIGFDNHAELVMTDKMAGSPQRVAAFIEELQQYTGPVQDREYALLLERLRDEQPGAERLQSWQRRYIQSKVSRERFGVDSREVRRYFDYESTRDGLFELVQDLFDVRIEPVTAPVWREDVEAYELREGDRTLGRFYLDMHPRDGKFQHAAMFPFVVGIEGRQLPVAALVCNFPRGDEPMQFSQVETFLHEFGHLLHFQFAGHQPWSNVSGISTEWDFVEAPSQMLEEWIWDHDTVSRFARNAAGEPLPADLHAAMVAERDFGLGMGTRGQLAYAKISLAMHDRDPDEIDFDALYDGIIDDMTRFESLPGTHRWASFGHLNGYSAIYYTYQWSLAIATDLFTRFQQAGLRDPVVAAEYRERVLEPGGSRPADQLVEDFLGREVRFEPYAERLRDSLPSAAGTDRQAAGTGD